MVPEFGRRDGGVEAGGTNVEGGAFGEGQPVGFSADEFGTGA